MASLTSLPIELLNIVASHLPTKDLSSLRRSCKHVESFLLNSFAREFFSKKQFMLTEPSLAALVAISKHPILSKQLKHVIIGLQQYQKNTNFFTSKLSSDLYWQGLDDQTLLLETGLGREMLTEAFQNLSLETVGIRDFSSKSRDRDRDGYSALSSYGATTVFQETGIPLSAKGSFSGLKERTLLTLLYALGRADRTPPKIEVLLHGYGSGLLDSAFNVSALTLPTVKPLLSNLKTLLLTLDLKKEGSSGREAVKGRPPGLLLRRFLALTHNLTHLRLNLQPGAMLENHDFLEWLAKPVIPSPDGLVDVIPSPDGLVDVGLSPSFSPVSLASPPVTFAHLECIDFGLLIVDPSHLVNVVAKFAPTLKVLSLWRVTLDDGHKTTNISDRFNHWAHVFSELRHNPELELDTLLVGHIKFIDHSTLAYDSALGVDFKIPKQGADMVDCLDDDEEEDKDAVYEKIVQYIGSDMTTFLKGLEKRVHVNWPEVVSSDSESDGSVVDDEHDENMDLENHHDFENHDAYDDAGYYSPDDADYLPISVRNLSDN